MRKENGKKNKDMKMHDVIHPMKETENNNYTITTNNVISEKEKIEMDIDQDEFDVNQLQESLIPAIVELTLDKNWRVRLGVVEKFPLLISVFGMKFFKDKIFKLTLGALQDMTAEIRLAAAQQLYQFAVTYDTIEKKSFS